MKIQTISHINNLIIRNPVLRLKSIDITYIFER
jgi:hypothetical protein